jgi:homoserine O-acetyltransferase
MAAHPAVRGDIAVRLEPTIEGDFTFAADTPFLLESGEALQPVTLHYAIYGRLREEAILVCHALSGSARVADWWKGMFGPGRPFDTDRECVIGINILGSCYGSTGPASVDPRTGKPYGPDFPLITIRDMVRSQQRLLTHLGVERLHIVIGGSIGGMQALQWAVDFPEQVETAVAIGATPLSAMGLALNHLQRQAIQLDPEWRGGRYERQPARGLGIARAIAMCTYKSAALFNQRFARKPNREGEDPLTALNNRYDIAGYLDYQGEKLVERFDANCYLVISKAMDTFEPGRGYRSEEEALRRIRAKVLLVGISSDWLFPTADVLALLQRLRAAGVDSRYVELTSDHGHDGFLADTRLLAPLLSAALPSADARPQRPLWRPAANY